MTRAYAAALQPASRPAPIVTAKRRCLASAAVRLRQEHHPGEHRHGGSHGHGPQATSARCSRVGSRPGMARAPISSLSSCPSPLNARPPTPLESRHGNTMSIALGLASPRHLHEQDRSDERGCRRSPKGQRPSPAAAIELETSTPPAASMRLTAEQREPAADGDERRLGADHRSEDQARTGPEARPRQAGWVASRRRRARCGTCPLLTRQVPGRTSATSTPGEPDGQDRPPDGHVVAAELGREIVPDDVLQLMHRHQEAPRRHRDRYAEQGGHQQQLEVARTVQCRDDRRASRDPSPSSFWDSRGHGRTVLERHPLQVDL